MVGIEERVGGDFPSLVPGDVLLVNEDAHELRNRKRGMRLCTEVKVNMRCK